MTLTRKLFSAAALSAVLLAGSAAVVLAGPGGLDWGSEVNPAECDAVGPPIVSVVQHVVTDVDSGLGGFWAFDNYTRKIQVWATSTPGEFCALAQYSGQFDAQGGQTSPGTGGTLVGDEDGTFQGGYRATITGTLLASPAWNSMGTVGNFDYQCDLAANCPGRINWVDQYFAPGYTFTFDWWGWIYRGGSHGTWINSSDGNSGDIL